MKYYNNTIANMYINRIRNNKNNNCIGELYYWKIRGKIGVKSKGSIRRLSRNWLICWWNIVKNQKY